MRHRAIAIVSGALLLATFMTHAGAQPSSGGGDGSDIEMEPDPVGSGSGSGSGSATETPVETPPEVITKDPKVAKKWLAAAQQLVQKGDYFTSHGKPADAKSQYENAIIAFGKAIEAGDDPAVNFQLATVEDKLGGTPDAIHHLKLAIAGQGVKPDVVKKAQAKLDDLLTKVGMVKLTISPEGTTVTISGKPYGESPLPEPLALMPGTYTASFAAAGYQPKDAEIKVEAGSESERKIDLEPIPISVKPHITEPEPEPDTGVKKPSPLPLYVGIGATGVFLLTATITGISAISQHHAFTDPTFSNSERKDAQSTGRTMEHVTDLCLVGMLGAAAFTAYWYQYKYRPALDAPPPSEQRIVPKVDVIPWVQPDGGGFVVAGSY